MPLEIERKFLLAEAPNLSSPLMVSSEMVHITQTYLAVPGPARVRVRQARTNRGGVVFTRTAKTRITDAVKKEDEHEISEPEYQALLTIADRRRKPIKKIRRRFLWNGMLFELDQITSPSALWVLEIELKTEEEVYADLALPPGIKIDREVTFEKGWSNATLATR